MRAVSRLSLAATLLCLLTPGCGDTTATTDGNAGDLSHAGPDLSVAPDLVVVVPTDLAVSPDLSAASDGGTVVCNLGNDPLPCANDNTCAPSGARCDGNLKACVCITPNCMPGVDQTCNDDPRLSSFHGHCNAARSCQCLNGFMKSQVTGKCL